MRTAKSSKRKATTASEKRSRAQFKRSDELMDLMRLVSLVPPKVELPDVRSVINRFLGEFPYREPVTETILGRVVELTFDECFRYFLDEDIQKIVNQFLILGPDPDLALKNAKARAIHHWYTRFAAFRKTIREIAEYFAYHRKKTTTFDKFGFVVVNKDVPKLPWVPVALVSPDRQKLGFANDSFLKTLQDVPGDRIRTCEICDQIFWAKRSESATCSNNCLNNLRQKRHRERSEEHDRRLKANRRLREENKKKESFKKT